MFAMLPSTSERTLSVSVYEDMDMSDSVSADQDDQLLTTKMAQHKKMEAIKESDDGRVVESPAPPITTDADMYEFTRKFIRNLKRGADIEEVDVLVNSISKHASASKSVFFKQNDCRRASTNTKKGDKVGLNSSGKSEKNVGLNVAPNTHPTSRGQSQRQMKSKSVSKIQQNKLPSRSDLNRSQSAYPSLIVEKFDDKRKSTSPQRQSGRERSHSGSSCDSQSKKYSIGESLKSEKDIIIDSNVEKIIGLKEFECCMVRRSGGRWTYSIVSQVNKHEMTFVIEKHGKQKKIGRQALLHNVRRIKKQR